ncbi:MAG: hypothetical protein WB586_08250 [Chthoniobacterales bacterium]
MKSAPYVLMFFLCAGVSYGQGIPRQPPKQAAAPKLHEVELKDLPDFTRYDYVKSPRDPFLDKSVTTTIMDAYKPSVIDNLILVSWLNDAGRTVVYVQNTETNEVQKITSVPNKGNFRIVEIHPNPDPKLVEVVISNGDGLGAVKFRMTPPRNLNPQLGPASSPASQIKGPQK